MNTNLSRQNEPVGVSLDVVWQGAAGKFNARIGEISMVGCFIESMEQAILGENDQPQRETALGHLGHAARRGHSFGTSGRF